MSSTSAAQLLGNLYSITRILQPKLSKSPTAVVSTI